MTKIDFPGFPGLDFGKLKFHDFPGFPGTVRTLSLEQFSIAPVLLQEEIRIPRENLRCLSHTGSILLNVR
jgi:hypothetical protein